MARQSCSIVAGRLVGLHSTSRSPRESTTTLWEPTTVGALELPHRLAMASMTRSCSTVEGVPTPLSCRQPQISDTIVFDRFLPTRNYEQHL